ncbi:DUF1598 domain-containing protein [Planctomicrobium sp. SH668]|uniref:DUF1598 domain-containing protein n=1 Tax=Planctomicrobium sp. SH668 TaxID=3448126 RepID=UPI003F5C8294
MLRTMFSPFLVMIGLVLAPAFAHAQFGFPGGPFGPGTDGPASGIIIDANGVVQVQDARPVHVGQLKKQIQKFANATLPTNVVVESAQRVLSLKNLEEQLQGLSDAAKPIPVELMYLAGLQRIDFVVFNPETRDVLIVGPAEAFGPDAAGRMIGLSSGRPALRLDDLLVALRVTSQNEFSIGCSIDPQPQNMQSLQNFLRANSTPATTDLIQARFQQMGRILGQQEISVWGVPETSHFATALVEADIRMKRISLGLEPSGVPQIKSHLSMLKPQGNSLQRWWFVPMFEPLETNSERTIFGLKGQRAKLLSQEEITDAGGRRSDAAVTRVSTERFAQKFTEHFEDLAEKSAPFAELQNLYDLAVVGALIQIEGKRHLKGNEFPILMTESRLAIPQSIAPKRIPSQVNYRDAGNTVLGLVGGVNINVEPLLRAPHFSESLSADTLIRSVTKNSLFGDGPEATRPDPDGKRDGKKK